MSFLKLFPIFFFAGINAYSACISYRFRPVLWNPKGDSVIILKQGLGPDGGGSVELFVTRANMEMKELQVSSTVHPDGSQKPESVSQKDCLKNLKEFNQMLALLDFPNFLHESTCKEERDYLFNKKIDTTTAIESTQQSEILKQIEFTKEASVFSFNKHNYVVAQTKANCSVECFWVYWDAATKQYSKKGTCLPSP